MDITENSPTKDLLTDENFFVSRSLGVDINKDLPLRLQKKELLEKIGLPVDEKRILCKIGDGDELKANFDRLISQEKTFLIVVSENPIRSTIPPLFKIESSTKILWRNGAGEIHDIEEQDILKRLEEVGPTSWVEFVDELWGKNVIAGKLVYINSDEQRLELQKDTTPAGILRSKNSSVFSIETKLPISGYEYRTSVGELQRAGYDDILPFQDVQSVADEISTYLPNISKLAKVSPLPTLEFAFLNNHRLIFIDVDWPSQYKFD